MNIESTIRLCLCFAPLSLAACTSVDTGMGDSLMTAIAVQTIDPDPAYAKPLESADGTKAAAAVERYRGDKVTPPQGIRTTTSMTGTGRR